MLLVYFGFFTLSVLFPVPAQAAQGLIDLISQGTGYDMIIEHPDVPDVIACEGAIGKVGCIFTAIVRFLLFIAGVGATVMIIIAGVRLIISTGNDEEVTAARNTVLHATIGLLAVMLSYLIVAAILGNVFGVGG